MDIAHLIAAVGIPLMLLGVTSRSDLSAETEPVHDVPKLEGITVDGHPEDWGENGLCASLLAPVNGWSQAAPLRPAHGHDVRIRLGWNGDGLLVLMSVRDDEWVEHPDESWLFTQDAIEMFLGTRRGAADFCQWAIAPGMAPDHPEVRWRVYDHRTDPAIKGRPLTISVARTKIGQECVLEALLPWEQLGIEPVIGREIGFQIWINDLDSTDDGVLTYHVPWHRLVGTNVDTDRMNRVRLTAHPSPPQHFWAAVAYDLDSLEPVVEVRAPAAEAGSEIALLETNRTLGVGVMSDDGGGRAAARVRIPAPPFGQPYTQATIQRGGEPVGTVRLGEQGPRDLSRALFISMTGPPTTDWQVRLALSRSRFGRVCMQGGVKTTVETVDGGSALLVTGQTRFGKCTAVVELDGPAEGDLSADTNGVTARYALADLEREAVSVPIDDSASLRLSAVPNEVALGFAETVALARHWHEAVGLYLSAAQHFGADEWGARALMGAAELHTGRCLGGPISADSWDRAIRLYQRVADQWPDLPEAQEARWAAATCTGCWARHACCWDNQGKEDWPEAMARYRQLYALSEDPGSKSDALRRIAEIQCNCTNEWRDGLATYRRILEEFPAPPAASPYPTMRTCGTPNSTDLIDYDLMDFTFERLLSAAASAEEAVAIRDAFVSLGPPLDTVRFHSLWRLALALRELGAPERAAAFDAELGLCDRWLVIGPFGNRDRAMADAHHGPERDVLGGSFDLGKAYDCSADDGRQGQAMWVERSTLAPAEIWEADPRGGRSIGCYALTFVDCERPCTAQLRVGASACVTAWLNRQEVLTVEDPAGYALVDQYVRPVRLKAGRNELFIKLAVSDFYSVTEVSRPSFVRVTDDEGVVPAGITCSVPTPPATNEQRSDFLTERVAAMEDAPVDRDAEAVVLKGIEPLDWGTGEMCEFASALTRTLGCAGENVPYHYVMGVTGVAFRFTMGPELWNPGFYGFEGVSPDVQDLVRRAFAAVGYEYDWYARGDRTDDLQRIADSIDRGIPVMLRGHVIDASDWALITGYARDGDTLYGSSPYGGTNKFKGYDVIEDWHARTKEYIILGGKCGRPAAATIYAQALRLAVQLVRSADRHRGLNAYDVLTAALRDEEFPEDAERQEDQPGFRYLCLLCYNMMLDDHASAAPFLRDAAEALPEARTELLRAADCYEQSRVLRDRLEGILPSDFSAEAQRRVLDPGIREEFARVLEQIRESAEQAIAHIERALAARGDGNP
jgi:tetratricopeptide (TPR) repeat protein